MDYDVLTSYNPGEQLNYDGKLDLVKATLNKKGITHGMDIFLHSDILPGSELGASSTMAVVLVGTI